MASEKRTASDTLELTGLATLARVLPEAQFGDFFSVVRVLERIQGDQVRIGSARSPNEEWIRFSHDASLSFSAGDIDSAVIGSVSNEDSSQRDIVELTSTFLGLVGGVSPLPPYFADEVAREDPFAPHQRSFLDIFHHRLLSLFYRSVVRFDLANEFELSATDDWSQRLLALSGAPEGDTQLPAWLRLRLTPLLATHVRTAHTLEVALRDVLSREVAGLSVSVSQFLGGWMELGDSQRVRLGIANVSLGLNTILGQACFDPAARIRVTIGPLTKNSYRRFLADGDLFAVTGTIIRVFSDEMLDYQLELVLAEGAMPPLRLMSTNSDCCLGKNTWLGQRAGTETRHYVESA